MGKIKLGKNRSIKDSRVTKCHVVQCKFYAPYELFKELFTGREDITPGPACSFGDMPKTPKVYTKPIGYLTEAGKEFSLRIPSKGYISGRILKYGKKKQVVITSINFVGKRSLVSFRQLWELLRSAYGKLEMYLLWNDGGCYSLKLDGMDRTCDILSEYPEELTAV